MKGKIPSGTEQYPAVPGYWLNDPDGVAYFAVAIDQAGMFGENLAFINPPDALTPQIEPNWQAAGQDRVWHWGPKKP